MRKQSIRKYIIDFREYLENKGLAPLSIEHRMTAVKSFYKSQYIVIQEIERRDATKPMEEHKGIPEKESIRKILEVADPLEKAIILMGV